MENDDELNTAITWGSKRYYELGLIGLVLGLSNTMYLFIHLRNLGPVFLGPYLLFTLVLGIPLVILELSLSQYGRKGMIKIWALCPMFKGLGFLSLTYLLTMIVETLSILVYLSRYIVNSCSSQTGWDTCTNSWNTQFCFTLETNTSRRMDCYDTYSKQICDAAAWESSHNQYWFLVVQKFEFGMFQSKNIVYSLGVTFICFVLSFRGLRVIERLVFFFLTVAAIEFTLLFYGSLIQQGSGAGISHFVFWDLKHLADKLSWASCFKQAIISMSLAAGGLTTLGSQNKFRGHAYMNGMMIILVELTVTILYTFLYLSLCGNLSYYSNLTIETIMSDEEMEFWSKIPRMLQRLRGPVRFWQFLFYTQIFFLLISKMLVMMFVLIKTVFDIFPQTARYFISTAAILYLIVFVISIPVFTKYGDFVRKQLIDAAFRGPMIILVLFLQTTAFLYFYGLTTVVDDMHFMLGFRLKFYFQVILFLAPIILCVLWVMNLMYFHETLIHFKDINLTRKFFLNSVAYSPLIVTISYMLWYLKSMIWNCKWENALMPHDSWFLSDPILRKSRQMFSAMSMTKEYLYRQSKRQEKPAFHRDGVIYK